MLNVPVNTHIVNLVDSNISTLESAIQILEALPDDKYSHIEKPVMEASVGKHIRHMVDHYLSFQRNISQGLIDYDQRQRDTQLEVDKEYAIKCIKRVQQFLRTLIADKVDETPLHVVICSDVDVPGGVVSASSTARELSFLHGHSIHHFALIAVMLRMYGLAVPREFGIAPSTLAHEETVKVSA